jgi:hypothetical protein
MEAMHVANAEAKDKADQEGSFLNPGLHSKTISLIILQPPKKLRRSTKPN